MESNPAPLPKACPVDNAPGFRQLLERSLIALLLGAISVTFCYFVVDQPVAFYVHEHNIARFAVLKWLTYPPPILQSFVPAVLVALMVRRAWGPFRRWELALLAASVSLVLADQFRVTLAYAFGRYWPETWVGDNPSLIGNGAYGFHPFHSGAAYGSFPSGHTARTLAIAAAVWIAYPGWRWACVVASMAVALGLLGMNYHFVGDVIAGGFVGGIVGAYTTRCCGLSEQSRPVPDLAAPLQNPISYH
jgi:membrane-associated phospholipid phosphatase